MLPRTAPCSKSIVLAALAFALACDRSGPFDVPALPVRDDSPLQTDRLVYTLTGNDDVGWSAELIVRYENSGSETVYLPGCQPGVPIGPQYGFSRAAPDTGRVIFSIVWACVGGVPGLPIPPGASRTDTLQFLSLVSPGARPPEHSRERIGLMRVEYAIYERVLENGEADWRALLPESERQSNVFEIRYP